MNQPTPRLLSSLAALRQGFDSSFASPVSPRGADLEQFLAIRSAGRPLALPVAGLTRLESRREIVALPAAKRDLLGIAGIQGRLVPIFCLAGLLGLGRDSADWRWIAVCGLPDPLGLAFESLDACFAVPRTNVLESGAEGSAHGAVQKAVRFAGEVRNIVQLGSLETVLRSSVLGGPSEAKES